jgi:hypothetical protein
MAVFICSSATAAPTIYTNEAAWLSALQGLTVKTETFSDPKFLDAPLASGTNILGPLSVSLNKPDLDNLTKVTIIGGSERLQARVCDGSPLGQRCASVVTLAPSSGQPMQGFAADWYETIDGDILTMTVNGVTFRFDQQVVPGTPFLGVYDSQPFTELTLGLVNIAGPVAELFNMDNARLAEVPAPPALILLGSALAALGWRRTTRPA